MATEVVRDPIELAAENAVALIIGHCPCGGKLGAAVCIRLDEPGRRFRQCDDCKRTFTVEVPRAG